MHAYLADDFVHGGAVGGTGAGDWPRSDWKALMDGGTPECEESG